VTSSLSFCTITSGTPTCRLNPVLFRCPGRRVAGHDQWKWLANEEIRALDWKFQQFIPFTQS